MSDENTPNLKKRVFEHLQAEISEMELLLERAVRFQVGEDVYVEKRGEDAWCVSVFGGTVLDRDLQRHCEPMPSNRTDEFVTATRFSLSEAMSIADRYVAQ
jgi:hypothetical protein